MGLCISLSICNRPIEYELKDLSYIETPVQAAKYAHGLKKYDEQIGQFLYQGDIYKINDYNGFYNLIE